MTSFSLALQAASNEPLEKALCLIQINRMAPSLAEQIFIRAMHIIETECAHSESERTERHFLLIDMALLADEINQQSVN